MLYLLRKSVGASGRNRTGDLFITSEPLYRLSHTSLCDTRFYGKWTRFTVAIITQNGALRNSFEGFFFSVEHSVRKGCITRRVVVE